MIERPLFTPEHEAFRDSLRRFMDKEIAPLHAEWEERGYVDREVWHKAGANGFLSKSEGMSSIVQATQAVLSGYAVFPNAALAGPTGASGADLVKTLSDRELTVLQQLARGMSNKEIGDALLISNKTVSSYKTRLFEKLNISTLVELVDFARANNLIA